MTKPLVFLLAAAGALCAAGGAAAQSADPIDYCRETSGGKSERIACLEAAITALMVHLGILAEGDPVVQRYLTGPLRNWRGLATGELRRAEGFPA